MKEDQDKGLDSINESSESFHVDDSLEESNPIYWAESENCEEKNKKTKKQSILKEFVSLILNCALILIGAFLIIHFIGQRSEVIGESMYPTLENADQLIVDKISYRFTNPERFEIIVFPSPDEPGKNYIKRIIGLPGETVQIIEGVIYINGQVLEEHYGAEVIENPGIAREPVVLGQDEYFVLGDNRNHSKDSRYEVVGNIRRNNIIGRVWIRIWPIKNFGVLKHQ